MTLYFELINHQFRETALYFGIKKGLEGQTIAHRQVDSTNNSYIIGWAQKLHKTGIKELAVEVGVDFYMFV
jgi:hypothetical protein